MAKNKKSGSRLFRTVKEQSKQKGTLIALSEMERLRNEKWLTMIFTVSATRIATDEAYRVFIDPERISANLPNKCKNSVIQLEREMKKLDKLIKDVIDTMDKEVLMDSPRVQELLDSFDDDGLYDNFLRNTEIKLEFLKNLIEKLSPGEIQNIMDGMNKRVKQNIPVLIRADLEIFFIKTEDSTNYFTMNIIELESFCQKHVITDLLVFNHSTGRTLKVKRSHLKEIYQGTHIDNIENFVDTYFKNIK